MKINLDQPAVDKLLYDTINKCIFKVKYVLLKILSPNHIIIN